MRVRPITVILATADGMGKGDSELQRQLAAKYFQLLLDDRRIPAAICFYTDGVKLACEGSPALNALRAFQEQGVPLIVCTTCLHFYGLNEQLRVGIAGSMPDIIEAQWRADKVITI